MSGSVESMFCIPHFVIFILDIENIDEGKLLNDDTDLSVSDTSKKKIFVPSED